MSKRITGRPATYALPVLMALASGGCSALPVSSAGPADATPGSKMPDAGVEAADASAGDAANDAGGSAEASSTNDGGGSGTRDGTTGMTDSGSGDGPEAQGEAGLCFTVPCSLVTTTQPLGLAVDETKMYWRTAAGALMSASVDGTGVSTVFASPDEAAGPDSDLELNDLVIGSTSAYLVVNRYPATSSYVRTALLDGTGASTLDVDTNVAEREQAIAVGATALYVARYAIDPQGGSCPDVGIDVVPLNGGPTTTLRGACALIRMAVDSAQNVYWTDRGPPPYITGPSVMTQSVSAAAPAKLASAAHPYGIAVYGGMLYWSDAGSIMVMPLGGGAMSGASVLSSSASPQDLVVDSSGVYWIDSGTAVMKAPLAGGAATTIAQGQTNVVGLGTNSTSVFWVNEGTAAGGYVDGAVMKAPK